MQGWLTRIWRTPSAGEAERSVQRAKTAIGTSLPDDAPVARLRSAKRIVLLTGAGLWAESGIPTFREAISSPWRLVDPLMVAHNAIEGSCLQDAPGCQ